MDILKPVSNVQIVDRDSLKPNDYNPNRVLRDNLDLLKRSIMMNGWTLPIVVRPDMTIIDGFHRWTVAGEEPLKAMLGNKVPVVVVSHEDESQNMYGTVTHNRARGTHLLEPMEKMVQKLLKSGKSAEEIGKEMGMKLEEVYRLSGMGREQFMKLMVKEKEYTQAYVSRVF